MQYFTGYGGIEGNKLISFTIQAELFAYNFTGNLILCSVIDNLTKGASGQAVQNLNIRFGLDETAGLL